MYLRHHFTLWALILALVVSAGGSQAAVSAMKSKLASQTLLLDYATVGERLVAVGEFGNIIYSDNQGVDWEQADAVETRVTLTAIIFIDEALGFAVGHDSTILKTMDGGRTWTTIYQDSTSETPLFDIYFRDSQNGFSVGAFGTILRTTNGGESWTVDLIDESGETDYHLNSIFADGDEAIYVAAENGGIFKSTDGGKKFRLLSTPYDGSFWGGTVLTSGRVMVWGMRGNVYYSDNDGQNWIRAETGTNRSISGGLQLPNGQIILVGLSGLILSSTDNGSTFQETVRSDRRSYATVSRGANGRLVLYGDPGIAFQDIP